MTPPFLFIFLIFFSIFAPAKMTDFIPRKQLFNTAAKCESKEFNDSINFIADYLGCVSGDPMNCSAIYNFFSFGLSVSTSASTITAAEYVARRILSMSSFSSRDAKRKAFDESYRDFLIKEFGDKKVDKILKDHGNDYNAAIKDLENKLTILEEKNPETSSPKSSRAAELRQQIKNIESRASVSRSNKNLFTMVTEDTKKVNERLLKSVEDLDTQLANLDDKLRSNIPLNESEKVRSQLALLEKAKSAQISKLMVTETQVKDIAEKYNEHLEHELKAIRNEITQSQNPLIRNRRMDTLNSLKKLRLKVPKESFTQYSRLMLDAHGRGYSLIDINGEWKTLPQWAKDTRIDQFKALPDLVRKVIIANPGIETNPKRYDEFIEKLSEEEHERYRDSTRPRLERVYRFKQQALDPEYQKYTLNPLNSPLESRLKTLTHPTREDLVIVKGNWLEVDVPYKKLDDPANNPSMDYKSMTKDSELKAYEASGIRYSRKKAMDKISKRFLLQPYIGKAAGLAARWGAGGMIGFAAPLFYDIHDFTEGAIKLLAQSEYMRENYWHHLNYSCRMPTKWELGAPNPIKTPTRYFCGCQDEDTPSNHLPKMCQIAPSEMDDKTQMYCDLASISGRDRDLLIAKAYSELNKSDQRYKDLLKQSVGCNVMKNYRSNCRFSTNRITEQGLYYLNLIQQYNLSQPVAELCPDVCDYWVQLAKEKMKELTELKDLQKLPKKLSENRVDSACQNHSLSDQSPPKDKFEFKKWLQCQKPITCQSIGSNKAHVRVNLSPNSRYEIDFNTETLHPFSVSHYYQMNVEEQKTSPVRKKFLTQGTEQARFNFKTFQFDFQNNGQISKLTTYALTQNNQLKETFSNQEIRDHFEEDESYNSDSNDSKPWHDNFPLAKRTEMYFTLRNAINFCCNNKEVPCFNGDSSEALPSSSSGAIK